MRWRTLKARLSFTMPCSWVRMDKNSGPGLARFRMAPYCPIDSPSAFSFKTSSPFRRLCSGEASLSDSGGLDESLWYSADWDFWLRLGALGPVRFIAEKLSAFRVHPASQTAARQVLPNEWEQQLKTVLDRHLRDWSVSGSLSGPVGRAAMASVAVNSALSTASRGGQIRPSAVLLRCSLSARPGGIGTSGIPGSCSASDHDSRRSG